MSKNVKLILVAAAALVISAVVIVLSVMKMGVFNETVTVKKEPPAWYHSDSGTAVRPEGRTLVITILVTDKHTTWEGKDESADRQHSDLGIAVQWMEEQAEKWGKSHEMIWDWKENSDLVYRPTFSKDMLTYSIANNSVNNEFRNFIDDGIPSAQLAEKYDADNVIYMTCFETTNAEPFIYCFASDCYFDPMYQYDCCFVMNNYYGAVTTAAVYAHEMLHLFGSPDLYKNGPSGSELYGVTEEFVDYARENLTEDIMFMMIEDWPRSVDENGITFGMSDLIAYYIGYNSERPSVVDEFGLDYSQHDPDRAEQMSKKTE
ncbi:MAG: hypothetical protein J6A16_10200 [Oscillospiraceae bacterium]|nr:hypothetical protein [Oscillospiraceae bacterium]